MPFFRHQSFEELKYALNKAVWKLKWCWWPTKCCITEEKIWLKNAYHGTVVWTGPGDPAMEYYWLSNEQYLLMRIKGEL